MSLSLWLTGEAALGAGVAPAGAGEAAAPPERPGGGHTREAAAAPCAAAAVVSVG